MWSHPWSHPPPLRQLGILVNELCANAPLSPPYIGVDITCTSSDPIAYKKSPLFASSSVSQFPPPHLERICSIVTVALFRDPLLKSVVWQPPKSAHTPPPPLCIGDIFLAEANNAV